MNYIPSPEDSPLFESLTTIGFEDDAAARLIRRFPSPLLSEWVDITQAAKERFGKSFFHKSPMAYLVDSVTKAAAGNRTAPDWWQELSRVETQKQELSTEARRVFANLRKEVFGPSCDDQEESPEVSNRRGFSSVSDILSSK